MRMQTHSVVGGGGVRLHVVETGDPSGQAILFLHGFSGGYLVWRNQLESVLAQHCRLVAMDLRGHGLSDKPLGAYADSDVWADDVQAVIVALGLEQPILSGWSFGGVVISDYLRHYGEERVGGLHLVGGNTKLGEPVMPFIGPKWEEEAGGMFANDVEAFTDAARRFLRLLSNAEPSHEDLVFNLGVCMMVPLYVRQGMFSRTVDNDDVLATVRKPVLISHGEADAVILPALALRHGAVMPHAQLSWFPDAGHALPWEEPGRFNAELGAFAERVAAVRRVLAT